MSVICDDHRVLWGWSGGRRLSWWRFPQSGGPPRFSPALVSAFILASPWLSSMASSSTVLTVELSPWASLGESFLASWITGRWNAGDGPAKTRGLIPMSTALNPAFFPALMSHCLKDSLFLSSEPSLPWPFGLPIVVLFPHIKKVFTPQNAS